MDLNGTISNLERKGKEAYLIPIFKKVTIWKAIISLRGKLHQNKFHGVIRQQKKQQSQSNTSKYVGISEHKRKSRK